MSDQGNTQLRIITMSVQDLNKRKKEILDVQSKMLMSATEAKRQLAADEEIQFATLNCELDAINTNITRITAIEKGQAEVGVPSNAAVIPANAAQAKFFAAGIKNSATPLNVTADYVKGFWNSLRTVTDFQKFQINNSSLADGGSASLGGALVPVSTDPNIPMLAIEECSARQLSRCITTSMNLNLPFQASLTASALTLESNSVNGVITFPSTPPTFATTLLQAYQIAGSVTASWDLLEDVKAAQDFVVNDLQRSIVTAEEHLFINGTGTNQPQGYLGNAAIAAGPSITNGVASVAASGIDPFLDASATVNKAYYKNASWLVNRQEYVRLYKSQIALNQFQPYMTLGNKGQAELLEWPVYFSGEMPIFSASPATQGSWLFGDFNSFACIGTRYDTNIRIQVNPYVFAPQGQTFILGWRRADQRVIIQQAVVQLQTNG